MRRSVWVAAGIAAAAIVWIASGQVIGGRNDKGGSAEPIEAAAQVKRVRVRVSRARDMQATLPVLGQTVAKPTVMLRAETSSRVQQVLVDKGRTVKSGQPLIKLALEERPARLAEAKARLSQRALAYDQTKQLESKAFASRTEVAAAWADLKNAQASLAVVQQDLAKTTIVAPFDGVFDENLVDVGDTVSSGMVVGRFVKLNPMTVIAHVSERNRHKVMIGGSATATLIDGRPVTGTLSWMSEVADTATRTYRVEALLPNADRLLASGLSVSLALPTKPIRAHLVSSSMLTLNDVGQVGVKGIDAANRVIFYPVTLGEDSPQGIWLSGLPERVRLISVGQNYVTVGETVVPVEAKGRDESKKRQVGAVPGRTAPTQDNQTQGNQLTPDVAQTPSTTEAQ